MIFAVDVLEAERIRKMQEAEKEKKRRIEEVEKREAAEEKDREESVQRQNIEKIVAEKVAEKFKKIEEEVVDQPATPRPKKSWWRWLFGRN